MRQRCNPHSILAIDPGMGELGYAVLAGRKLLEHGVLALRPTAKAKRLKKARDLIAALLERHQPDAIVLEKTYPHPLPWLHNLHRITLAARRLARARRIPVYGYAPQLVRKTVVGNGKATKKETAIIVASRFPQLRLLLAQDRRWKEQFWLNDTDAVALGLHHQAVTPRPISLSAHPRKQPSRSR